MDGLLRLRHHGESVETVVGHLGDADVRVLRRERVRRRERTTAGQRVVQRALARVGEADESETFHEPPEANGLSVVLRRGAVDRRSRHSIRNCRGSWRDARASQRRVTIADVDDTGAGTLAGDPLPRRAHETGFKAKAFGRALDVVRSTPPDELAERAANSTLTDLDGIGSSTATVISDALAGRESAYLAKIEAESQVSITPEGQAYRDALKGDCHLHSTWSDGGAPIAAMAATAIALGHEYIVQTDHSARLTIAHGLNEQRLAEQLDQIDQVNADITAAGHDFRVLSGMEVDILEDGALDLADEMLERLDVVVASVHSKLRMDSKPMTERMLMAVASPHVDILGHCTGRMIGKRPPSEFDADYVFAACAQFNTAVEINCRPERLDPPRPLLDLAIEYGCWFSIDSDAHATGQLEWQPHGCDRAANAACPSTRSSTRCRSTTCSPGLRDRPHDGSGWGVVDRAVAWQPYVEEDQEEEGQDAPLQGESWQAPQHGSLTYLSRPTEVLAEALVAPPDSGGWCGRLVASGPVIDDRRRCETMDSR